MYRAAVAEAQPVLFDIAEQSNNYERITINSLSVQFQPTTSVLNTSGLV